MLRSGRALRFAPCSAKPKNLSSRLGEGRKFFATVGEVKFRRPLILLDSMNDSPFCKASRGVRLRLEKLRFGVSRPERPLTVSIQRLYKPR